MNKVHGHTTHSGTSPTYKSWHMMKQRCNNPNYNQFKDYGGRGIQVCERWLTFENFLADMGVRPPGMSLDRKEQNGHYEPGNCRWASRSDQQRNRRTNRVLELDGRAMLITDWAKELDLTVQALIGRINRGWPLEQALTMPAEQRGRRKARAGMMKEGAEID